MGADFRGDAQQKTGRAAVQSHIRHGAATKRVTRYRFVI